MTNPNNNNDSNKELIEALKTDEDEYEVKEKTIVGFNIKKILFVIIIITILLIIILWLLSIDSKSNTDSYSTYETKMITAAKQYYKVNKNELPLENNQSSEVTLEKLIQLKYMENYSKIKSCTGIVTVEKTDDSYKYNSYLDCGDNYSSKSLLRHIIDSNNSVNNESGLYRMNNEYVYRGENPNNYVSFGGRIWRVVKIDSNNDIVLILNRIYSYSHLWDDRYNVDVKRNYGYNIFEKSRIRDYLDEIYQYSKSGNNDTSKTNLLTKTAANKIVSYKLCIGKIDVNQSLTNNTYECQKVLENTKIGLLTTSDYINASLDASCNSITSESCQNYNYLATDENWWLVTASTNSSYETFLVSYGIVEGRKTNSRYGIRPVIHLSGNTRYTSGEGTEQKPYVIK